MTFENEAQKAFLLELYRSAEGGAGVQRSMHTIGAAIGLDKERAGKTAEDLIGKGWVEIKTLSGGIGLTAEGIDVAQQEGAVGGAGGAPLPKLGKSVFLAESERAAVEKMLAEIKQSIAPLKAEYAQLEEMVLDVKTIEVHLLSPRAKTAVVREVLRALQPALTKAGAKQAADRIGRMIG
ncbi:MAG: hypothetical protein HZB87_13075 [Desulfatitalea sp.]|nr:hypothetical protein [Desulfatitalea sp.]MBI5894586.1 hypothetical protein [Desulfobacterales bacterium]